MTFKKPWTVMVYLAADNNLTNFGIDNLKQMKAVCGDSANILAEFYSGSRRPTKRYLFDHKTLVGSIEQNVICELPPKDAGDPRNLAAFVEWAVKHYQAEHYFLIIWGHGSGCDDDFPQPKDSGPFFQRSFAQRHQLLNPSKGVLDDASKGVLDDASKGVLDDASKGVLDDASKGVLDDAQKSIFPRLASQVSIALKNGVSTHDLTRATNASLPPGVVRALQQLMCDAFEQGVEAMSTATRVALSSPSSGGIKALAFSDHPASHLTNLDLKKALQEVCSSVLCRKLDIVGMDACNMNMVEIGYEIRDCADYMVASQDSVPDASWPYDAILRQLIGSPDVLPGDLARITTTSYVENYRSYVDQPVTLSVLDLGKSVEVLHLFKEIATHLERSLVDPEVLQAIISARKKARSFGKNQFVDVVNFCECLTEEPGIKNLGSVAVSWIGRVQSVIACNKTLGEKGCSGTSIYLPVCDPVNYEHQQRLAKIYGKLDFAQETGWGKFVGEFLQRQKEDWDASESGQKIASQKRNEVRDIPLTPDPAFLVVKANGHDKRSERRK